MVGTDGLSAESMLLTDMEYNGLVSETAAAEHFSGRRESRRSFVARALGHEVGHTWTYDHRENVARERNLHTINSLLEMTKHQDALWSKGKVTGMPVTYHSSLQGEYVQGALAGYNILRDVTGKRFDNPQMIHKALDEMVANPKILDQLPAEPARIFRSYLHLREHNPKLGESLRRALARDCQYLGDAGATIREAEGQLATETNNPERIKEAYPSVEKADRLASTKSDMLKTEGLTPLAKNGLPRPRHFPSRVDDMNPPLTCVGVGVV